MKENTGTDLDDFQREVDDAVPVKVPPERRNSLASAIGFVASAFFFLMFLVGIGQVYGQLIALIIAAFSAFGWDPILTSIFMSFIFLFLAVTFHVISRRGSEAVSKMEAGLKIMFKNPPTRFYDTSNIPPANLIRELVGSNNPNSNDRGRGCILSPDETGSGFTVRCDTIPETRAMQMLKEGKLDQLDFKQKALIIGAFLLFGGLLAIVTFLGLLGVIAMWILWIVFLFAFFYVMVELRIMKLWAVPVAWIGINVFLSFTITDPYFLWTMWGAWVTGLIVVAIFYVISKDACVKKESWYCDFL